LIMKSSMILISLRLVVVSYTAVAQQAPTISRNQQPFAHWSIEPAVGIHTNFGTDVLLTNLLQWNPTRHLSLGAHSSYDINNVTQREFNNIKTEYNYSLNQKFGIGRTFYSKRSRHTVFFMAGAKYTAFKEVLDKPAFDRADISISSWSPDYGLMYSLKKGVKNCFFTFRAYLPLYPFPIKGSDINYADGNMNNIALEFGAGIRLK
jgi:hypothetical protein